MNKKQYDFFIKEKKRLQESSPLATFSYDLYCKLLDSNPSVTQFKKIITGMIFTADHIFALSLRARK